MSFSFPNNLAQITPELITQLLQTNGIASRANVTDLHAEIVTGAVSFHAQIVRLWLRYDRPEVAPPSLIVKLPTPNLALHANALIFRPGAKEDWFYRRIALLNQLQAPRCYYSAVDPATGQAVLVLEDLATAQRINQITGIAANEARLVLRSLAALHAHWWQRPSAPEIAELAAINGPSAAGDDLVETLYAEAWPQFVASGIAEIPSEVRCFGDWLVGRVTATGTLLDPCPKTLIHGDFRLDNMLFDLQREPPVCWLLDWEDVAFGCAAIDLTWFLGGCLQLEASDQEEELLRFYHHRLVMDGVTDYSWMQCLQEYRYAMISSFVQGILSSTLEEGASGYQRHFAQAVASRFIAACQRLRLYELGESNGAN